MNRNFFLQQTMAASSILAAPFILTAQTPPATNQPKPDPLPAEKVKDFVGAGHNNLDKVKQLLTEFLHWYIAPGIGVAAILKQGWKAPGMLVTKTSLISSLKKEHVPTCLC